METEGDDLTMEAEGDDLTMEAEGDDLTIEAQKHSMENDDLTLEEDDDLTLEAQNASAENDDLTLEEENLPGLEGTPEIEAETTQKSLLNNTLNPLATDSIDEDNNDPEPHLDPLGEASDLPPEPGFESTEEALDEAPAPSETKQDTPVKPSEKDAKVLHESITKINQGLIKLSMVSDPEKVKALSQDFLAPIFSKCAAYRGGGDTYTPVFSFGDLPSESLIDDKLKELLKGIKPQDWVKVDGDNYPSLAGLNEGENSGVLTLVENTAKGSLLFLGSGKEGQVTSEALKQSMQSLLKLIAAKV